MMWRLQKVSMHATPLYIMLMCCAFIIISKETMTEYDKTIRSVSAMLTGVITLGLVGDVCFLRYPKSTFFHRVQVEWRLALRSKKSKMRPKKKTDIYPHVNTIVVWYVVVYNPCFTSSLVLILLLLFLLNQQPPSRQNPFFFVDVPAKTAALLARVALLGRDVNTARYIQRRTLFAYSKSCCRYGKIFEKKKS